ncbi:MAG: histidine phosphatase family protein [Lachnospiraceae bacterium]|jgi:Fructose-2,6-bisphosphatase|nr:histidine phosphatase family protein [Lachnospiraceae bacterium]MCI8824547.1 histidine phosphatase family protein [Lachnospiraceae bacterium]MCI9371359.1 histidine phosphatase family protein [Lachnospiraceae bacterium]
MKVIFIRHGDPDYINDTLTEKGRREAALLSDRVSRWDVKQFYCSPLGRARDTAEYSMQKMNRTPIIYDWLKEFYYPITDPLTGKNRIAWDFMPEYWTEQPELYDKDQWIASPVMKTGEELQKAYREVCSGIDDILAVHGYERYGNYYKVKQANKDTIVFFCHLGVSFVMMSHILGLSAPVLWQQFFVAPTSVTLLCTEEREKGNASFRVKVLGDTSHLLAGGEPASDSGFFQEMFEN